MSTTEEREARRWLVELAARTGARYRVSVDSEGWPRIPGKVGNVEWTGDRDRLAVHTDRSRMIPKLAAVGGVTRWQIGDTEARFVFPPDPRTLQAVCAVIRARIRRSSTTGNVAVLARARAAKTAVPA